MEEKKWGLGYDLCKDYAIEAELVRHYEKVPGASAQGSGVWGDLCFLLFHGGACDVLDLKTNEIIGHFRLGSATEPTKEPTVNHANQITFSGELYEEGDEFPLAYIVSGNAPGSDADGWYGRCSVERIRRVTDAEGKSVFTSECVQTIVFNESDEALDENFHYITPALAKFERPGWGWPSSFADAKTGSFYIFCARFRTKKGIAPMEDNSFIVTRFALPDAHGNKLVILRPTDILDQFITPFDAYATQGGTLHKNRILYTFGFGREDCRDHIRIFDLEKKALVGRVDLSDCVFKDEEIEDISVYGDRFLITTNGNPPSVYLLSGLEDFI